MNAYEVLGVSAAASDDEIQSAYRRFSKVLHPDINKRKTATEEFKELNKAYALLRDPALRREHDYALAVVETKGVEKDAVDDVLDNYGIDKPKKKKKKKKKQKAAAQSFTQPQESASFAPPPPQYSYGERSGQGQFEGIPGGYEDFDTLGGIL